MTNLQQAIKAVLIDDKLPCARAFAVAEENGVDPIDVGRTATKESIKISHCQLGLFGYPENKHPLEEVKEQVTSDLRQVLTARAVDGRLTCKRAWQIASDLKIPKLLVSATAEELHIRIRSCQLGCFK